MDDQLEHLGMDMAKLRQHPTGVETPPDMVTAMTSQTLVEVKKWEAS